MKIDRLIGIITLLLQRQRMTAPQLAERFEVSKRTINRDIEDICRAGIPIVTTQGTNGGISIMDSYKIDKTILTDDELRAIFTGLSSLESVTNGKKYSSVIEKLSAKGCPTLLKNNILIDLSSHYKDTLAPKIELLQTSIENSTRVSFFYHRQDGSHFVVIDPYLVVFQWASWYALGYDNASKQFKLYKLNKACSMKMTDEIFELQNIPEDALNFQAYFTDEMQAVILFDQGEKYRLIDEYGADSFVETPDGKLRFTFPFTNQNYLLSWVLSFGEKAELLEPKELRPILKERLGRAVKNYFK